MYHLPKQSVRVSPWQSEENSCTSSNVYLLVTRFNVGDRALLCHLLNPTGITLHSTCKPVYSYLHVKYGLG